jgi:RimJ/RimL family protein N-acetyltransferase
MREQESTKSFTTTLEDGREVTIRPLEEQDREALIKFGKALPEDDWLYLELDFHNPNTITRLTNASSAENWRQMVATADGEIVGYSNVRMLPGWKSHVADIHVVVGEGWRRSGLGSALARAIIDAAPEIGVNKVIAEMLEEQTAGRTIFEHLGFQVEGQLREHARDHHGQRHTMLVLGYVLNHNNNE